MRIHFIGIGGIGVSALAQYYLAKGHKVSGSDLVSSEITELLKKKGAKITIGKNIRKKDADLTVYSPAATVHSERVHTLSYPQALGKLTKEHFTIAVAGTHGKSTTTAMLGLIMVKAGLDPTVIVGTKVKEFAPPAGGSNCRVGKSRYLVIEADEHFASFLNYWPKIIVLTNIEPDHLDYYKNFNNIKRAFKEFIFHLPEDGVLISNSQFPISKQIPNPKFKIQKFSFKQKEAEKLKKILKVPGKHNILNALAALKTARALKIPDKISFEALSQYRGSWRRFEIFKASLEGLKLVLVSDYGHHPTEIEATLKAARERWPKKKIWCVYQPHQYRRTYHLFNGFVRAFKRAPIDKIVVTDIYDVAGREEKKIKDKVNSKKLTAAVNSPKAIYLPRREIIGFLKANFPEDNVLVIMGAGDIYDLISFFHKKRSL